VTPKQAILLFHTMSSICTSRIRLYAHRGAHWEISRRFSPSLWTLIGWWCICKSYLVIDLIWIATNLINVSKTQISEWNKNSKATPTLVVLLISSDSIANTSLKVKCIVPRTDHSINGEMSYRGLNSINSVLRIAISCTWLSHRCTF